MGPRAFLGRLRGRPANYTLRERRRQLQRYRRACLRVADLMREQGGDQARFRDLAARAEDLLRDGFTHEQAHELGRVRIEMPGWAHPRAQEMRPLTSEQRRLARAMLRARRAGQSLRFTARY